MRNLSNNQIDVILTSPFYNTNRKAGKRIITAELMNIVQHDIRYDKHVDNMSNEEYSDFTANLFDNFDRILRPNGSVLYNISYGAENTECMFKAINAILTRTKFTIADVVIWKKRCAIPNNRSSNKLTRITEFVFVFCRKKELKTFHSNKKLVSIGKNGVKSYENIFNLIEAKNNDGVCPYNKATYSSELCEKLLNIYAPPGGTVYDPFMGTGTTAVACQRMGLNCYGSEISDNQVRFSIDRIKKEFGNLDGVYSDITTY